MDMRDVLPILITAAALAAFGGRLMLRLDTFLNGMEPAPPEGSCVPGCGDAARGGAVPAAPSEPLQNPERVK